MADFKETIEIEYDVPSMEAFKQEFAAQAQISEKGDKVTLGSYTAKKPGLLGGLVRGLGMGWMVKTSEDTQSLAKGALLIFNKEAGLEAADAVDLLAGMAARDSMSEDDKAEARRQAIEAKLQELGR